MMPPYQISFQIKGAQTLVRVRVVDSIYPFEHDFNLQYIQLHGMNKKLYLLWGPNTPQTVFNHKCGITQKLRISQILQQK